MNFSDFISPSEGKIMQPDLLELPLENRVFKKAPSFHAIWVSQNLEPVSKLILLSLSYRCNAENIFKNNIPLSIKTLCEESNSSYQTVSTHLKKLKKEGYLSIENASHKKRVYNFTEKLFLDYKTILIAKGVSLAESELVVFEGGIYPEALRKLKNISSSQKLLLLWLVAQCKESQFLAPHIHRLEEMSLPIGLSKNSLTRAIRNLENKAFIHVIRTIKRPNVYALNEALFYPSSEVSEFSNNESKNGASVSQKSEKESHCEKNESYFEGTASHSPCCCFQSKEKSLSSPMTISEQENPTYSLYSPRDDLPISKEKKLEEEAFGIARYLLTLGKEEVPLCFLTVRELSKAILEAYGLRILQETKKLCFKYKYFGMSFHNLQWLCQEVFERRNPFQILTIEGQQEFIERKKQAEEKTKALKEAIEKKYIAAQYEQKKQEEKQVRKWTQNDSLPLELDFPVKNPFDAFRKTLMLVCLPFYHGPEDQLVNYINSLPPITLRMFMNEQERLPQQKFEDCMRLMIKNRFG